MPHVFATGRCETNGALSNCDVLPSFVTKCLLPAAVDGEQVETWMLDKRWLMDDGERCNDETIMAQFSRFL